MRMVPVVLVLAGLSTLTACAPRAGHPDSTETGTVTSRAETPTAAPGPSFDCAKADGDAEKLVCNDPALAALDRRLADEYQKALSHPGADKTMLEDSQHRWVSGRDDCSNAHDVGRCLRESYQTRVFELRTSDPAIPTPPVVAYSCPGDKPFTAKFYNDFDPRVAVLTLGEDSAVTFAEPAASGARYGRDKVEFWEHHGEVTVNFFGNEFTCHTA